MTTSRISGTDRISWPVVLAVWTVPAMLAAAGGYLFALSDARNGAIPWRAGLVQLPGWYFWAAVTPLIFALARRFPIERPVRGESVVVHGGASLLAVTLHAVVLTISVRLLFPKLGGGLLPQFLRSLSMVPMTMLMYWGILVIGLLLALSRRNREREMQASALAAQLAQAQLTSLRTQLHPHFLFNTLNAITVLVHQERTGAAVRVLNLLSEVLRHLLQGADMHEISLREEIGFIERYLEIEQVRFSDRLRVLWDVDDTLLEARVPNLLLQPLVENSIRHGIARRRAAGRIEMSAKRRGESLEIVVRDDGPGLPPNFNIGGAAGIGIRNTSNRLAQLYRDEAHLDIANDSASGAGAVVTVRLPLRLGAPRAAEPSVLSAVS